VLAAPVPRAATGEPKPAGFVHRFEG
jgi:hypothetical protein